MASTVTPFFLVGAGALTGCFYMAREYYLPIKQDYQKDQQRIRSLEEEIVRLKREMRICGIAVPHDPDSPEWIVPVTPVTTSSPSSSNK